MPFHATIPCENPFPLSSIQIPPRENGSLTNEFFDLHFDDVLPRNNDEAQVSRGHVDFGSPRLFTGRCGDSLGPLLL